jgi:hypothetical protein
MLAFGEPIPTVTSVSPGVGPATGGGTVTISGNVFTGATAVTFGTVQATSFTVNSATSITATVPPGSGTVDVTVTTPSGRSPTAVADRYIYQLTPTIAKLSPKSGLTIGGTVVTISGSEFTAASKVAFGPANAIEFTVKSSTSIVATAPPSAAGAVDVSVTNTAGTSAASSTDRFKFLPIVEAVTPNAGSTLGGASVTVTGKGFALGSTATTFRFGTVLGRSVNCTSSTTCIVSAPKHELGTIDVRVTVNKQSSAINAPGDQFTYS